MQDKPPKSFRSGLMRGACRRCPNCGQGKLLKGYMQVIAVCSVCGNNNSQYKADDGPAWLVLLIIGQFFLAPILSFKFILTWSTPALLGTLLPGAVVLTLLLLPLAKGLFIGLEWARS